MVESYFKGGCQEIFENLCDFEYGKLVIDGCIDWDIIEKVLLEMYEVFKDVLLNC